MSSVTMSLLVNMLLVRIVLTLSFLQIVYASLAELQKKSHTEEFEGVSALFRAMASSPSDGYSCHWSMVTSSVNDQLNCTVLYLDQCTSWNRCRQTCLKAGATSYRWFHDGCCECVGENCVNNGINESRCRLCPEPGLEDEED